MEVALWTSQRIEPQGESIYRKLRGSIVIAVTSDVIRRKWVEICGDLLRPAKRHDFTGVQQYGAITESWRTSWYNAWKDMESGRVSPGTAWQAIVNDGLPDLGNDPHNQVPLVDTWGWSDWERKHFYLGKLTTEDASIARKISYRHGGEVAHGNAYTIDYRNDLALSVAEIADVEDLNVKLDPDLYTAWPNCAVSPVCAVEDIIVPHGG